MKLRQYLGWIAAGSFVILGVLIYFGFVGYSFSAYMCIGIALLLAVYQLLHILSKHSKRTAAVLRLILSCCLGLGIVLAAATGLYVAKAAFTQPAANCEYIVVLGAGLHGSTPSMTLSDRLDAATDYLKANPDTICIVSGGQGPGEDIPEALCMYNILTARGIEPDRIRMEDKSTSTYENLKFSLELIEENTGATPTTLGIISSEYHIFRACETAKKLDIEPVGIPAQTSKVSLFLNYFFREIPAVWYYSLFGG